MGGAEAKKNNKSHAEPTADAQATKKPATAEATGEKTEVVKVRQVFERERGSKWSLERCKKYARRFQSEQEWKNHSPASYKAAEYHGWLNECVAHVPKNLQLVHTNNGAPTAANTNKGSFKVVQGEKHSKTTSATKTATAETSNVRSLEKKAKSTKSASASKDKKKKAS